MPAPWIGIIGDFHPGVRAHMDFDHAVSRPAKHASCELSDCWLDAASLRGYAAVHKCAQNTTRADTIAT
jgi:hypothetical protein